jgi:hypothetical protein
MSAALFSLFLLAARGDEMPPAEKGTKPLLIVMNEVVDRLPVDPITGRNYWNHMP